MKVCIPYVISLAFLVNIGSSLASTNAPAIPDPESLIESACDRDKVMFALGYSMAKTLRLNVGFKPEDLDSVLKGIKSGSMDEEPPATLEADSQQALIFYNAVILKAEADQEAQREKEAAPQVKAGKDFLEKLSKDEGYKKTKEGVYYKITEPGNEKRPEEWHVVTFHVQEKPLGGENHFDTKKSGEPVKQLMYELLYGLHVGMKLLGEGGKATFYIPYDLSYGFYPPEGLGIKPGSLIICNVELIKIEAEEMEGEPECMPMPPMNR